MGFICDTLGSVRPRRDLCAAEIEHLNWRVFPSMNSISARAGLQSIIVPVERNSYEFAITIILVPFSCMIAVVRMANIHRGQFITRLF
jgi:hypothetical protein